MRAPPTPYVAPRCQQPTLDAEKRVKLCGVLATHVRIVDVEALPVCVTHAGEIEEKRAPDRAPFPPLQPTEAERVAEEAMRRAAWDAAQAHLPPGRRRTPEQAEADDEARMGGRHRRGAR